MDEDGYPTQETIDRVRTWPAEDTPGLFAFLQALWAYRDRFVPETVTELGRDRVHWHVSTGGWSGHEDLIEALEQNRLVWLLCWIQSRRGGHYIFEQWVPVPEVARG